MCITPRVGGSSHIVALLLDASCAHYPLPVDFVYKTGESLLKAINKVAGIGYSINDIKPDNIYLDSAGM